MDKNEILKWIKETIDLDENAIRKHPAETVAVYLKGRDAFIEGQNTITEKDESMPKSLTLDDLKLLQLYMLSSSFMSAWYHLYGDKTRRDKLSHSSCIIVASLGSDPERVFLKYVEYEQRWRDTMKQEGIAPGWLQKISNLLLSSLLYLKKRTERIKWD